MTDTQSMTTRELVRRTLLDEHGDFLKEAVAMVAAQLMDAEVTAQIGAGHGEVSRDRVTHRNGYRSRGGRRGSVRSSCSPQEALGLVLPVVP
jgi:transposase-like protein